MTQLSWGGVPISCSRTTGRGNDARQFRDTLAADHAPDICCLQSGGRLREGIVPIGLGLRATGRERFGPTARAHRKAFDPLRARVRDGGFRLCAGFGPA